MGLSTGKGRSLKIRPFIRQRKVRNNDVDVSYSALVLNRNNRGC